MHLILFDIDGTLVQSYEFDGACYQAAVRDVLGVSIDQDWGRYQHVTDAGIARELFADMDQSEQACERQAQLKRQFIRYVQQYLAGHELKAVPGAPQFLSYMARRKDVKLAFATGGWGPSAKAKLSAAGLDWSAIPLASSCDHYDRIEIMRIAQVRAGLGPYKTKTYFGDGLWDLQASKRLGYHFVGVGERVKTEEFTRAKGGEVTHTEDFQDITRIIRLLKMAQ